MEKLSAVNCGKGQLGERGCVGYAAKGREGVEVVLWLGAGKQREDLVGGSSSMSSMTSANSRSGWKRALGEETAGSRRRREGGAGVGGDRETREVVPLAPRFR